MNWSKSVDIISETDNNTKIDMRYEPSKLLAVGEIV